MSRKKLQHVYQRLFAYFGPQHWWPGNSRFEIIVGAILTQNTNWQNVEKAIAQLKKNSALSLRGMTNLPTSQLAGFIRPAGYYNIKAKRLKHFLGFVHNHYKGSLHSMGRISWERLRPELLSVNGIGPETADAILLYAFAQPVFVIDAYTQRIFSRYGLISPDDDYAAMQRFFMRALPPNVPQYNEYHALIVQLAKQFCRPQPKCADCPLVSGCNIGRSPIR